MEASNVISQNEILEDVLCRATVNIISVFIGDAFGYYSPTVIVRCYTTEMDFETTEHENITLENDEFDLEINYDDGEFLIGLKSQNIGELGYIERAI